MSRRLNNESDTYYENLFDRNVNFKERIVYVNDDIDQWSLDLFQKAFDELEKTPDKPIKVEISSYGGSVYDMLGMVDRIKISPCQIITRGFGKIMSAAAFILAAGDERCMGKNSWFMIHEMSSWAAGKSSDLKIELKHIEKLEKQSNELLAEFSTKKVSSKTFEKMQRKDCYLSSQEVYDLGLVDKILGDYDE